MTGRVIEIRLKSPMPQLLQVLAQPELGLRRNGAGTGPMEQHEEGEVRVLSPLPPEQRGLPRDEEWRQSVRNVRLRVLAPRQAVAEFDDGKVDLVLGGTLANLPLADVGALSRGTVRLDAALGLFGLQVHRARGVLGDAALREAVAMAIDRESLMAPFNIGGWEATTRIVPPGLLEDIGTQGERWQDMSFEERQAAARRRVAGWRANAGEVPKVTIALPPGPGSNRLFGELAGDLSAVGITLERVDKAQRADLVLVDRIARYGGARWFLNQFNCKLADGPCSVEADARVEESLTATDPLANAALLSEAEAELASANIYIPIGAPIRWSLVRGGVDGFVENRWNLHPLFPLSKRPI
jgi:ABC-type transport system substrate-binding protein